MSLAAAQQPIAGIRLRRYWTGPVLILGGLTLALAAMVMLGLTIGAVEITPGESLRLVGERLGLTGAAGVEAPKPAVFWSIRFPRVLLAGVIGAVLGISGAVVQGLFRNPLAEPSLIGISSGAAMCVVVLMVLGGSVPWIAANMGLAMPLTAFAGGLTVTVLVYRLGTVDGQTMVGTMLLAGVAIGAFAAAMMGLMIFIANDAQIRDITFWTLGSLGAARWSNVGVVALCALPLLVTSPLSARALNALALGEAEALHLGVAVQRMKAMLILQVALAVGAAVAFTGIIGFVGLVVPHLLRLGNGPDHTTLIPGAALMGAALLVGADLISRTVAAPMELPIGVITALLGAPFFLWLLLRDRKRGELL